MTIDEAKRAVKAKWPDARSRKSGGSRIADEHRWRIYLRPGTLGRFHSGSEGQAWQAAAVALQGE